MGGTALAMIFGAIQTLVKDRKAEDRGPIAMGNFEGSPQNQDPVSINLDLSDEKSKL